METLKYFVYKIDVDKTKKLGKLVLEPAHDSLYGCSEARAYEIQEKLQEENPDNIYIVKSTFV